MALTGKIFITCSLIPTTSGPTTNLTNICGVSLRAATNLFAGYINITGIPVAHFGQRSFQRKIKGIGIGTQFSQGMNPLLNALSSAPIFPDNKALATIFQGDAVDPGSGKLVLKATYKIESVTIKVQFAGQPLPPPVQTLLYFRIKSIQIVAKAFGIGNESVAFPPIAQPIVVVCRVKVSVVPA